MGLFTTKSCFFCLSVRTGGLALGFLVILQSIFHMYSLSFFILSSHYSSGKHMELASYLVLSQLILFASIAWLYGVFKKKASWMLAFVAYISILLIALIGFFLVFFVSFFIPLPHPFYLAQDRDTWVYLVPVLPLIVLLWHFTAVVYSLYKNVKGEKNNFKPTTIYPVIENKV